MDNYKRHINIGLKNSGAIFENLDGKEVMLYQSGMKKEFKLAKEDMSKCVCEVMGTYNAMILAGYKSDFLKLAVEFEVSGLNDLGFFKPGVFGSDPKKIKYCLNAHNVGYSKYNSCEKLENNMKKEKSVAIVAHNFKFFRIHTFAVLYNKKYATINEKSNIEYVDKFYGTLEKVLKLNEFNVFFNTGYILKEKII